MTTRRRTIESRLFDAVLLVLASAGCQPAPTGVKAPDPDPKDDVVAADDKTEPTPPVITGPWPPADLSAERDPARFCAAYKQSSRVDATKAKPAMAAGWEGEVAETGSWHAVRGAAQCTIVRERVEGTITTTHTPTCCPSGRGNEPCPPSQTVQVPGIKTLVEFAELRPDGSVALSKLQWQAIETHPQVHHNCGRRPEGMSVDGGVERDPDDVGCQLAEMAELEAASVPAFERLASELAAYGAPEQLVRRARAAMRDEVRHARVMTDLAARHGRAPRAIDVARLPVRSLEAIARENAIEGCVREAYGALVATYQAECAAPELRTAFRAIATDERRHAALAEDVHAWILDQLDGATRSTVTRARSAAELELRAVLDTAPPCAPLGIPGGAQAVALFDAYFAS